MPIPLPNLDDRTFDDLTLEARALIPGLAPEWTNHNVSDPGITLVELLAWLTEMLIFQVNQVPAAHTEKFLRLLNGPGWTRPETQSLGAAARQTVLELRRRYRAVDAADYEALALQADETVRRARCVAGRNLEAADDAGRQAAAPAHVSLVVVPRRGPDVPEPPQPPDGLRTALWSLLDERRMLTIRHHVVGPSYVPVQISANLALQPDAPPDEALQVAQVALASFLDPLDGGPGGSGWPFGCALSAAEIYAVLEQLPLVDYVEDVRINDAERQQLDAHELPQLSSTELAAYDSRGVRHEQAAIVQAAIGQAATGQAATGQAATGQAATGQAGSGQAVTG